MKNDELIICLKILIKKFNSISKLEFEQDEYLLHSCFKVINLLTTKTSINYCHLGRRVRNAIEQDFGKLSDLTSEQITRTKLGYLRGFMHKLEPLYSEEEYKINIEDFDPIVMMIENQTNLILQDWITPNSVVRFFSTEDMLQEMLNMKMLEKIKN
ncbi:MAG TPA: hypothetical protein PLP75_01285 [Burkholderiales bacterium]|nr:hypothetical protein [Burkholderiales bacterium]